MRIFMVIKKLRYSGAYKMFMWVANALAEKGHEVTVFTYMNSDVEELPEKIRWIKADLENSGLVKIVKETRRQIKDSGADVSISFLLDANIINTLACIGTKTKSIICERNDPFKPHYYKLQFTKWMFRFANGAVFQLPKVAEFYSMIKGPTAVIPNPVIPAAERIETGPFEKRENIIVSLGRLDIFQKRQDILLNAFARFLKGHPDYKLYLFGDGPDEEKLRLLANELGITEAVCFKGITNSPLQELSKTKFFVMTSDFEGIPNALIEAMSIGLPCISTDCRPGGARLLIENGKSGIIVPPGDANKLCEQMEYLTDNPQTADKLGEEAAKSLIRFSEAEITDKWDRYLKQVTI